MLLQPNTRYRCVTPNHKHYNQVLTTSAYTTRGFDQGVLYDLTPVAGGAPYGVYADRDYAARHVPDVYEPELVEGQYYRVTSGEGPFNGGVLCEGTCFYVPSTNFAIITTPGPGTLHSIRDDNFEWYISNMPADTVTEKITAKEALGDLRVGDVFKLVTGRYAMSGGRYHISGDEYKIVDADNHGHVETAHASYGTTFWDYHSLTDTDRFALVERGQIPTEEAAPEKTNKFVPVEHRFRTPQVGDKYRVVSDSWLPATVGTIVTVASAGQELVDMNVPDGLHVYAASSSRFDPNDRGYALEYISEDAETEMEEAARITTTDRNDTYGDPAEDHARTGRMWGATLGIDDIPAETVALMMAQLKISREVHKPGRDNRVDMHGYIDNRRAILESKGLA